MTSQFGGVVATLTTSQSWTVTKNGAAFDSGTGQDFTFTPDDNGSYVVTLVAENDQAAIATANATIAVTNAAPTVSIIGAPDSASDDVAVPLSAAATDLGTADTITLAWTVTKDGTAFGSGAGSAFTFTPNDNGIYAVTVTATDDDGGVGSSSAVIFVTDAAPVAAIGGAPATSTEGTPIGLVAVGNSSFAAVDLAFAWSVTKNGAAFGSGAGPQFDFTPNDDGSYVATLTVSNIDTGEFTSSQATVSVSNVAPVVSISGAPDAANSGVAVDLLAAVLDPGTADTFAFQWSVELDGQPFDLTGLTIDAAAFSFTPTLDGVYAVSVVAADDDGGTAGQSATFLVTDAAPVAVIAGAPTTSTEGAAISVSAVGNSAIAVSELVFNWAVKKNGVNFAADTGVNFSFTPDDNGTYLTTLTVEHPVTLASATATATTTVTNVAPAVSIGGAPGVVLMGTSVPLAAIVSDPGSADTHTFAWQAQCITCAPGAPATATGPFFNFMAGTPGTYLVSVTAEDDDGSMSSSTVAIEVKGLDVTIQNAPPGNVLEGMPVNLTATVNPPTAATFTWNVTKNGSFFTAGIGANFMFTPDDDGDYQVSVTATAGSLQGKAGTLVTAVNQNPFANIASPIGSMFEGSPVTVNAMLGDPGFADVPTLAASWTVLKDGVQFAAGSAASFTFTPDDDGLNGVRHNYQVSLTVTDDDGGSTTVSVPVMIENVPPTADIVSSSGSPVAGPGGGGLAPMFIAGPTTTVEPNGDITVRLLSAVKDPGTGDTFSYNWIATLNSNPIANGSAADFSFTLTSGMTGTIVVTLDVADDDGGLCGDFTNPSVNCDSARIIVGSDGNDTFTPIDLDPAGTERVVVFGFGGNDTINATGLNVPVELDGGPGNNNLTGGNMDDVLVTDHRGVTGGHDVLAGGFGRDRYRIKPGSDVEVIEQEPTGFRTIDTIDFGAAETGIQFNLGFQGFQDVDLNCTSPCNRVSLQGTFEELVGSSFGDSLTSNVAGSMLFGGDGGDTVNVNAPDVTVFGGAGDDTTDVMGGTVTVFGGEGADDTEVIGGVVTVFGGEGDDVTTIMPGSNVTVFGGDGDDDTAVTGIVTIFGGDGDDSVITQGGAVTVFGGAGDDAINVETGQVTVFGGDGIDDTNVMGGAVTVFGGDGDDTTDVSGGIVTVFGGAGDDDTTVSGGAAEVTVFGGDGIDDTEVTGGTVTVFGGEGDDTTEITGGIVTVFGGAGDDDTTVSGGAGAVTVFGGDGDDDTTIAGGTGAVTVFGGDGADDTEVTGIVTVFGGDGDDTVISQGGAVTVFGGEGDDTLDISGGSVTVFGGDGIDDTEVTGGTVTVFGGEGDDTTDVSAGTVTVFGGDGADDTEVTGGVVTVFGGEGDDDTTVSGGAGAVTVFGGDGADETTISDGAGAVTVFGGDGEDTTEVTGVVTIFGGDGEDAVLVSGGDVTVFGGDGDDTAVAGGGDVTIFGGGGDDETTVTGGTVTVFGGDGIDDTEVTGGTVTVFGGEGDDTTEVTGGVVTVFGGDGDDDVTVSGGTGAVTVFGGDGVDETTITGGAGAVTVFGGDGADTTEVTGVVTIFGGDGEDAVLVSGGDVTVFGGDGDDTVEAAAGAVTVFGGDGADDTEVTGGTVTVFGGEGDDTTEVTGGVVTVFGGEGDDDTTISGGAGAVTVFGGDGADETEITGGANDVTVFGGAGDDDTTVLGGTGEVTVFGGDGNDETTVTAGAGDVTVFGGDGADTTEVTGTVTIFGGDGDDAVVVQGGGVTVFGGEGNDTIEAGAGVVTIFGGDGDDTAEITGGIVTVFGGAGDDDTTISDGAGAVTVFGGDGADETEITGGANDVTVFGGAGDDDTTVLGGTGEVTVFGGDGNDETTVTAGAGDVTVFGCDGEDTTAVTGTVTIFGGDGDDAVIVQAGDVTVFGGEGDDTIEAGSGVVTIFGGDGDDTTEITGGTVTVFGGEGDDDTTISGGAGAVTEFGGDGADETEITGGASDVTVFGGAGDDDTTVLGGTGEVTVFGGDGNDETTVTAGAGDVTVFGGDGEDTTAVTGTVTLFGGDGEDAVVVQGGDVTVFGGEGDDTIEAVGGVVTVFGGDGDDTTEITGGTVTVFGGEGDDDTTVSGGTGAVTVFGGDGMDETEITGGASDVTVFGGDGDDDTTVSGGTGAVTVFGGDGIDETTITGGTGDVTVFGGDGEDTTAVMGTVTIFGGDGDDAVFVGSGDVTVFGGDSDDMIAAGGGVVTVFGGDGSDDIEVTGGTVTVFGGAGDDATEISGGTVTVFGGSGDDDTTVSAGAGAVTIFGGDGNDETTIIGGTGDVTAFGGGGDDDTTISGGTGAVTVFGGDGEDTTEVSGVVTIFGGDGLDAVITGGAGDVTVFGGDGVDTIEAGAGEVTIFGGDGDDVTEITGGMVTVFGGDGDDETTISGGTAEVTVFGGNDDDTTVIDGGVVTVFGGDGEDVTEVNSGPVTVFGGDGDDTTFVNAGDVTVFGGTGNDRMIARGGSAVVLSGEDGDDTYEISFDTMLGTPITVTLRELKSTGTFDALTEQTSDGSDTITFAGLIGIVISLSIDCTVGGACDQSIAPSAPAVVSVSLFGVIENVIGTPGNDVITGNAAPNLLVGGTGDDQLFALAGDDVLDGGQGSDLLDGDGGNDTYFEVPGSADDIYDDSGDSDTIDFSGAVAPIVIDLRLETGQPQDVHGTGHTVAIHGTLENVTGSAFADAITGSTGANLISGGDGNDTITGLDGDDVIEGGAGDDVLDGNGGNDTYVFAGTNLGSDAIVESNGVDTLDFSQFQHAVTLNLGTTNAQTVAPGGLELTINDATALDNVVGSSLSDSITGNSAANNITGGGGLDQIDGGAGNDQLQGSVPQIVFLDFVTFTDTLTEHEYTLTEQDAIFDRLQGDFTAINVNFTMSLSAAEQAAAPANGDFISILFNAGPSGGAADALDFRNLDRGGSATINVNPLLGGQNQPAADSANFIGLTATVTAHEIVHSLGLRHGDSFGPIGSGIFAALGASAYLPSYAGSLNATETPQHVMASPDSVHTTLFDAAADTFFGARELVKLAFADAGDVIGEQPGPHDSAATAQPLGALTGLNLPGTTGLNIAAIAVVGSIGLTATGTSEDDHYSFEARLGDVVNIEIMSNALSRVADKIDSIVTVLDSFGQPVPYFLPSTAASNDDEFETQDSIIIDLPITADGTYTIRVDTFRFTPASSLFDQFCSNPASNPACSDTDTGDYELFVWLSSQGTIPAGGDTLIGGAGADSVTGSSGNDQIYTSAADGDQVDSGGQGGDQSFDNGAPVITNVTNDGPINEGSSATITVEASDSGGTIGTLQYEFDCNGDMLFEVPQQIANFTPCSFNDDGSFVVNVRVTDVQGFSDTDSTTIVVDNVAPTGVLSATNDVLVNEGPSLHTYNFSISDPGDDTITGVTVSCGVNGTLVDAATFTNSSGSFQCTFTDGPATSDVSASATDSDNDTGAADSQTVTVNNVAPTVMLIGDSLANEGLTKTYTYTVNDPGNDPNPTITESCGAGAVYIDTAASNSFDCTFPDGPDSPIVSVAANDGDPSDNLGSASITVIVANVAPTVTLSGDNSANEGQTKTYTYTVSDPGDDPNPTITESCGAGSNYINTAAPDSFQCTFPDGPASPTVSVTANDGDPSENVGSASITVVVSNVVPTVNLSGPTSSDEGQTKLYTFTTDDPGQDTFSLLTITCGAAGTLSHQTFNVNTGSGEFDCTFPDGPASSTVSVQTMDSDNAASNTASLVVTVANVAPTVALFGPTSGTVGVAVNFTFSSFDPSEADQADIRYHIDWDGDLVVDQTVHGDISVVVAHAYTTAGTYTVRVFAQDNDNDSSAVATHVIEVALVTDVIVEGTAIRTRLRSVRTRRTRACST